MKKKILITGGTSRFSQNLKKYNFKHDIFYPSKLELDILDVKKIRACFLKFKPDIVIHLAGLSRPMRLHDSDINKSINLNIIGTANVTSVCSSLGIKIIYFSTNYVYPGKKGNYKESDALLPFNNYAWSKLGGECSVQMYKNSLILRICMTEKPFVHKKAFANVKTSFLYQEEVAKILFKLLNKKGIINIGGKSQFIYDFVKKENSKIKKIYQKNKSRYKLPFNSSLNTQKLKKLFKSNS